MGGRWRGLATFLTDPRVPLDNKPAERGLRGVVLGRKNHYGSKSERVGEEIGTTAGGVISCDMA
jgi:hypothetical protein